MLNRWFTWRSTTPWGAWMPLYLVGAVLQLALSALGYEFLVSLTCRFFGISRSKFYSWRSRYQQFGLAGLREYRRGPKISPFRVPPPLEALILWLREERRYGVRRLST